MTLWEMFSYGEQPYGDRRGVDVNKEKNFQFNYNINNKFLKQMFNFRLFNWWRKVKDFKNLKRVLMMFIK